MSKRTMLALPLALALVTLPAPASAGGDSVVSSPLTALDGVALLAAGAGHQELLDTLLLANVGVAPDYLGVAFHNTRTGARLDRQEIRELMGPVRQDGAYQLLAMATEMSGHSLPYSAEQLELLLDAAFLASMRRPPEYISVEYYDTREGPAGVGGGVSGRVPEAGSGQSPQSPPAASDRDVLPASEQALRAHFGRLEVSVDRRPGQVVLPLLVGSATEAGLERAVRAEIARYEREFGVAYVERIARMTETLPSGVHREAVVAYFRGDEQTVRALEAEMDGFFYRAPHQR